MATILFAADADRHNLHTLADAIATYYVTRINAKHAHTVYTRPSPQLWEAGPGDEANTHTHTQTDKHDDYRMPRSSAHRGITRCEPKEVYTVGTHPTAA